MTVSPSHFGTAATYVPVDIVNRDCRLHDVLAERERARAQAHGRAFGRRAGGPGQRRLTPQEAAALFQLRRHARTKLAEMR